MRKDELLHFHQLLAAVSDEYERRDELPSDALDEYDALSVSPVAAYESKGAHKRAVLTLAETLAACSDTQPEATDRGRVVSSEP